jgi:prolyl oligopeptidase
MRLIGRVAVVLLATLLAACASMPQARHEALHASSESAGAPEALPAGHSAATAPLPPHDAEDPFLWLEEVESPEALAWVEQRNAATLAELTASPLFQPIFERIRAELDSPERIAMPSIMGEHLYNFWQDEAHPRGVWRRTTWESYLSEDPRWEVVLDVDALAHAEGVSWSFSGASCLEPEYRRCLVRLSRGGADAVETREFDARTRRFVERGFRLPEARQSVAWVDENTLLVATDFGPGSMTAARSPRIAKLWRRGTPLAAAETIFEGAERDVGVSVVRWRGTVFVNHRTDLYRRSFHLLDGGRLMRLDVPADARYFRIADRFVLLLRSDLQVADRTYSEGSLVHTAYADLLRGSPRYELLLEPTDRQAIADAHETRDHLIVSMLDNVRGELRRYGYHNGRWSYETVPAPEMGSISVAATSASTGRYFFSYSGFTQPTTLYHSAEDGAVQRVRGMREAFDAEGFIVEQHEATSRDGTRIPYFVVRRSDAPLDGTNPTLLYGYGGFQSAMMPFYDPVWGATWLAHGGVLAVSNIRGGGEFGPRWHRAGRAENRQRSFDDHIAVAEDLIRRGITSPRHLGIEGGSLGGLLVGAVMTQRPELFGSVVGDIPLLDMRRDRHLAAGATFVAEHGDPDDPAQWEFIGRYSPYHQVRTGVRYPRPLFTTSTRDDRVHPANARKMTARMESMGHPVLFFENTEGGHGAGVTNEQRARTWALQITYHWEQLATPAARAAAAAALEAERRSKTAAP